MDQSVDKCNRGMLPAACVDLELNLPQLQQKQAKKLQKLHCCDHKLRGGVSGNANVALFVYQL